MEAKLPFATSFIALVHIVESFKKNETELLLAESKCAPKPYLMQASNHTVFTSAHGTKSDQLLSKIFIMSVVLVLGPQYQLLCSLDLFLLLCIPD